MRRIFIWLSWIVGSFMMAFSVKNIYEPANLVTGGFLGLGIIGEYCFDVPLWLSNLILNIPLWITGLIIGGRGLVLSTLAVTGVYTLIVGVLPQWEFIGDDPIVSAILGGMLMGAGLGLILRTGASSGGVDLISLMVNKKCDKLPVAWIMFAIDGIIIIVGAFVFGLKKGVYSIVSVWVVSYVVDKFMYPPERLIRMVRFGKRDVDNMT